MEIFCTTEQSWDYSRVQIILTFLFNKQLYENKRRVIYFSLIWRTNWNHFIREINYWASNLLMETFDKMETFEKTQTAAPHGNIVSSAIAGTTLDITLETI